MNRCGRFDSRTCTGCRRTSDGVAAVEQQGRVRRTSAQVVGGERLDDRAEGDLVAVQQAGVVTGQVGHGQVVGGHHHRDAVGAQLGQDAQQRRRW